MIRKSNYGRPYFQRLADVKERIAWVLKRVDECSFARYFRMLEYSWQQPHNDATYTCGCVVIEIWILAQPISEPALQSYYNPFYDSRGMPLVP